MCLAVPGKIVSIDDDRPLYRQARVEFGGIVKEISLCMTPDAAVGQYVLVHAGVAIGVLDEAEAARVLAAFAELDALTSDKAAAP